MIIFPLNLKDLSTSWCRISLTETASQSKLHKRLQRLSKLFLILNREYEVKSLKQDKKAWRTFGRNKPNVYPIKESSIPLEILFNPDIDAVRQEENDLSQKHKPITFHIEETSAGKNVKYEVEGGGRIFETMIVRQNEEVFFDFLKDFTQNKAQLHRMRTRIKEMQRQNTIKTK